MDKKIINDIVWWIPFKKLRNLIRDILLLLTRLDDKINDLDDKINSCNLNQCFLDNNVYEYDFIFSIGDNCCCAEMLKKLNIRKYAGPLDWVDQNSNIISRLEIIYNKFDRFIDKDDMDFIAIDGSGKFRYINNYNLLCFPHEFNSDSFSDYEYLEVSKKYLHRINRTINFLKNSKVLMVYIADRNNYSHKKLININEILACINAIRKVYNNSNIDLLYMQHYPFKIKNKIIFKNIDNIIHLYTFDNIPGKKDRHWMGNIDNMTEILKKYKLAIK
ncbi:DUF1796 family putative cysteine peptidase [Brachyspira pilosicoli]